jgi:hypothetical protein
MSHAGELIPMWCTQTKKYLESAQSFIDYSILNRGGEPYLLY